MATIEDNVTEHATAPMTIPANAPVLIPELEEVSASVTIYNK